MADIREILAALAPDDRARYQQHRSEMRRSYLMAHNQTVGMNQWDNNDDMFLDLIDIKLAILFDRAGRFTPTKQVIGDEEETTIIAGIHKEASAGTKMLTNGWPK